VIAYDIGAYSGQINQVVPRRYTGKIRFFVHRGNITVLSFTARARCGRLWVVDQDEGLPVRVKVTPTGIFAYSGTVNNRAIRMSGTLKGNSARGTLFESFPWGQRTCTMKQPAPFSATQ
jgi:hypothetical protein